MSKIQAIQRFHQAFKVHIQQEDVFELIDIASSPDWKYVEKKEFPEHNETVRCFMRDSVTPKGFYKNLMYNKNYGFPDYDVKAWCYLPEFDGVL